MRFPPITLANHSSDYYNLFTTAIPNKEAHLPCAFCFSTARLMDRIWGQDSNAGADVIWTYIGLIRGAGYSLEKRK